MGVSACVCVCYIERGRERDRDRENLVVGEQVMTELSYLGEPTHPSTMFTPPVAKKK